MSYHSEYGLDYTAEDARLDARDGLAMPPRPAFSPAAALAETERIAAVREEFRAAGAALTEAGHAAARFVEAHCPVAQEIGDAADRAYAAGMDFAHVLYELGALARRLA